MLLGLCLPWVIISFCFSHLTRPGPSLMCMHVVLPGWIPEQRLMGRLPGLIMAWRPPLPSDPEGSFCACVVGVSPTPRMGNR